MLYVDYVHVSRDILVNLTCLYLYAYVIIYYKFENKELFVTCSLFNIFVLLVVMTIVRTDFSVAIGFGLFALLALVQIRSATFTKTEMAYFFGAISMALVNGTGITDYVFVIMANGLIILSAWCISSWSIEHSANTFDMQSNRSFSVVFDRIYPDATNNPALMQEKLSSLFKIDVISYSVDQIDFVKDTMNLTITHSTNVTVFSQVPKSDQRTSSAESGQPKNLKGVGQ